MSSDRLSRAVWRLLTGCLLSRASSGTSGTISNSGTASNAGTNDAGTNGTGSGGTDRISVDRLAAEVAAHVDGASDDVVLRESIGLFLRQNLSRRDGTSGVELDEASDTVLTRGADLRLRRDPFSIPGLNWRRYYSFVSVVGIHLLLLNRLDGPLSTLLDATTVLLLTFVLLFVGSVCQRYYRQGRTLT